MSNLNNLIHNAPKSMSERERINAIWDIAFRKGKKYENELLSYLSYDKMEYSDEGCKEWDIQTTKNGIDLYYEVKSDNISYKSGNLCVEYSHKGQPSGINVCTADYWCNFTIINDKEHILYIIPLFELKQLIVDKKKYIKDIKGGTNRNSSLYLISLSLLEKYKVVEKQE